MKVLFDTSVIIAASLPQHPSHHPCFVQIQAAKSGQFRGCLSTHSLAEFYSVMTRMPSQPRIPPQTATALIESYLDYLETIPLEKADYLIAIAQMTALNLSGGGIFDALIAQAALKASAHRILTLNPNHFTRLDAAISKITRVPE